MTLHRCPFQTMSEVLTRYFSHRRRKKKRGEQEAQSIAPLIVPSEAREIEHGEVVIGDTGFLIAQITIQYKFELGLPLVENPSALTTQLYKLNNWYMVAAKQGR